MSRFLAIQVEDHCLQQAAAGDREAQRQVYEHSASAVFALIRRLVPGRAAAEDVFQDCMMVILDRVGDFRGEAPFGAWLRQVATRQCLMHLRSPWQRARRALDWGGEGDGSGLAAPAPQLSLVPTTAEPPQPEHIDVERALARLPATARAVVWLYDVEGLKHDEIAALFGRSTSFSKSQLSRAHALLRADLGDPSPSVRAVHDHGLAAQGQLP